MIKYENDQVGRILEHFVYFKVGQLSFPMPTIKASTHSKEGVGPQ